MLVPVDGSELAKAMLPHVEALAEQRGLRRCPATQLNLMLTDSTLNTQQA